MQTALSPLEIEFIEKLGPKLKDQTWRLNNLYYIKDKEGNKVRFKPNLAQRDLYENMHDFNVILKARQLGFSTLIMIYILDCSMWIRNISSGVIAQSLNDAIDLFDNKIRFAYDNLPESIKQMNPATNDSSRHLSFENGSSITVGTSLRGGTLQILHVSEYGKIAAHYPEKAKEIKTGAFNTVHAGQKIFVESTAEGQEGEFYELCRLAQEVQDLKRPLSPLDPKFFFYPWYDDPAYVLDEKPIITQTLKKYFDKVEDWGKIKLTDQQKAWYIKKARLMRDDALMMREFPSMPQDAFSAPLEGCIFGEEMSWLRQNGRITSVPYDPKYLVHTFWDLGISKEKQAKDMTTIWFFQQVGKEYRFIRYYEQGNKGIQHFAEYMRELGYKYGTHYWPHDGTRLSLDTGQEIFVTAKQHGIKPIHIIPRTSSLSNDIQATKNTLPRCWFDETNCADGIKHLGAYRREWNEKLGVWSDKARHDMASHGADAFRAFAIGYKETLPQDKNSDYNLERESSWVDW